MAERTQTITVRRCGHHCDLAHPDAAEAPVDDRDAEWELTRAITGQNLYHGRYSTTPAGRTTAMAIRHLLRQRGYDVRALEAPPDIAPTSVGGSSE